MSTGISKGLSQSVADLPPQKHSAFSSYFDTRKQNDGRNVTPSEILGKNKKRSTDKPKKSASHFIPNKPPPQLPQTSKDDTQEKRASPAIPSKSWRTTLQRQQELIKKQREIIKQQEQAIEHYKQALERVAAQSYQEYTKCANCAALTRNWKTKVSSPGSLQAIRERYRGADEQTDENNSPVNSSSVPEHKAPTNADQSLNGVDVPKSKATEDDVDIRKAQCGNLPKAAATPEKKAKEEKKVVAPPLPRRAKGTSKIPSVMLPGAHVYTLNPMAKAKWAGIFANLDKNQPLKIQLGKSIRIITKILRANYQKRLQHRLKIVNEILATEKNYLSGLTVITTVFLKPLQENASDLGISPDDITKLFSKLELIREYHVVFYSRLQQRLALQSSYVKLGISDLFLKESDFLLVYTIYINNYETALSTLAQLRRLNDKAKKFLIQCEHDPRCNMQDLESLLIQPIQRIPRYVMFLGDLLKHSSKGSRFYKRLKEALDLMRERTDWINEKKRQAEQQSNMARLAKRFVYSGAPAKKRRRYTALVEACGLDAAEQVDKISQTRRSKRRKLRKGVLIQRKNENNFKKMQEKPRGVLLYDDILILCKVPDHIEAAVPKSPRSAERRAKSKAQREDQKQSKDEKERKWFDDEWNKFLDGDKSEISILHVLALGVGKLQVFVMQDSIHTDKFKLIISHNEDRLKFILRNSAERDDWLSDLRYITNFYDRRNRRNNSTWLLNLYLHRSE
eukprot:TRINITY_DN6169_c0_g1_i2.p1 TRINITY_DN6169_c0_g1~~TRINITY_DN6169_c0_g1_i2.p1  ORF type:complete len:812 (-),score=142.29 TRINITY_DN6169_c0_g1_i2:179-2389(-)